MARNTRSGFRGMERTRRDRSGHSDPSFCHLPEMQRRREKLPRWVKVNERDDIP